jgi:hypothetical protein
MSFFEGLGKPHFEGIPIHVSPYVPEGEVWLFQPGEKATVLCHEGPQAGEEIEVWLKKATMMRVFPFPMITPVEIPHFNFKIEYTL